MNEDIPSHSLSPATPPDLHFVVDSEAKPRVRSLAKGWRHAFGRTLSALWQTEQPGRGGQIGVILVGTDRIRALNRDFRGNDRPTDVLSFDLSDTPDEIEGEIYISVDAARAQAEEAGCAFSEELARLVVHGALHLAGYDHHSPADGRRMAAATRRWLAHWQDGASPSLMNKESNEKWMILTVPGRS